MFKISAVDSSTKTYWTTRSDIAHQIAKDLERRFNNDFVIESMPDKKRWSSGAENVKRLVLADGYELCCTSNEFKDARAHARNNLLKINAQEIFCFVAEDIAWQSTR